MEKFCSCRLLIWSSKPLLTELIGLSKERPILDHHPKAHIHEIRRDSRVKSISKDQLPGMVSPMFSFTERKKNSKTITK